MRRAARTDGNQSALKKAFEKLGATVCLTPVGDGKPDAFIGINGVSIACEFKDGSLSPSRRRLREKQEQFRTGWRGGYVVAEDIGDVLRIVVELRRIAQQGVMP